MQKNIAPRNRKHYIDAVQPYIFSILLTSMPFTLPNHALAEESNGLECYASDSTGKGRDYIASSFQWENDIFFSDRWYTNGMKYSRTKNPDCHEDGESSIDNGIKKVMSATAKHLPFVSLDDKTKLLVSPEIGMNMYTPKAINIAAAQHNDRPWTGWLYYGRNWELNQIHETQVGNEKHYGVASKQKIEIQVGGLGRWAYQDRVQRAWHTLINAQDPMGWENQDAGRLGYSVAYTYQQNFNDTDATRHGLNSNIRVGAIAGNVVGQISLGGGVTFSWERFEINNTSLLPAVALESDPKQIAPSYSFKTLSNNGSAPLPNEMTKQVKPCEKIEQEQVAESNVINLCDALVQTTRERDNLKQTQRRQNDLAELRRSWERFQTIYIFADVEARYMFKSHFLEGTNITLNPFVVDGKVGLAWKIPGTEATARFSRIVRSSEFDYPAGNSAASQRFTQLSVEWNWGWVKNPYAPN
ncbi:hypothetical protein MTYP_03283 [Methylophilaceae bacterium]|nr:hypothetical protein MTYP_03283 [Methylophilaceae bacterium]